MPIIEKKPEVISVFTLFLALFQASPDQLALKFIFWLGMGRILMIYKHPHITGKQYSKLKRWNIRYIFENIWCQNLIRIKSFISTQLSLCGFFWQEDKQYEKIKISSNYDRFVCVHCIDNSFL